MHKIFDSKIVNSVGKQSKVVCAAMHLQGCEANSVDIWIQFNAI